MVNPQFNKYLKAQVLGEYYPGLFFSRVPYYRFSLANIPLPNSHDFSNQLTTFHESLHSLQDLSNGFLCATNEFARLRDESGPPPRLC